jgi:hypothetical protein
MRRLTLRTAATATAASGLAFATVLTAPPASADPAAGQIVHVVKDQAGGAYYNITTGERFDVTATSAATSLSGFAVKATNGLVLTDLGQILVPVNGLVDPTPAATVVQVAETNAIGTYQDAETQAMFVITTAGSTVPAANEWALQFATGTILTINNEVLLPVQHALGLG